MLGRDRWPRVCLPAPASPRPAVRVITASGPRVSAIPSQVQAGVDGRGGGVEASGRYQVAGSGSGLLLTARTTIRPPIGVARQKMTSQNI